MVDMIKYKFFKSSDEFETWQKSWEKTGRIAISQVNPVPLTLSGSAEGNEVNADIAFGVLVVYTEWPL